MNQKAILIQLVDLTKTSLPYGNVLGKEVFRQLLKRADENPLATVFGVSFAGIESTDASFARESVVSVAKYFREERSFYLTDLTDPDLIDNWDYAAKAKDQPLVIWNKDEFQIIGPELSDSTRELVEYVLRRPAVLASQAAADLNLTVPNASTRLKKLVSQGYIRRTEDVAETGGIEYRYSAIK